MKAQIQAANCYYYPDVLVTCDPRDRELSNFKRHPCLIVEVLSDKTEAFDRGDKFADYQQLDSLQEYVLISQAATCGVFSAQSGGAVGAVFLQFRVRNSPE